MIRKYGKFDLKWDSLGILWEKTLVLSSFFPGAEMAKNPPASAGDLGSVLRLARSPRVGNGKPLQSPCLENSVDRGAWPATVMGPQRVSLWATEHYHYLSGEQFIVLKVYGYFSLKKGLIALCFILWSITHHWSITEGLRETCHIRFPG